MRYQFQIFNSLIVALCFITAPAASGYGDPVADFSLLDVNATSSTYNQMVSPSDYLESATGWYFGHAT